MTSTGVEFLLPGTWWHVPLQYDEAVNRSSAALAERTFGRSDEFARARSDLRRVVVDAAQKARGIDASDFYLAMEVVPGAPLPVTLTVSSPQLPFQPSRLAGPQGTVDSLSSSLVQSDPDSTVSGWVVRDTGIVRAVTTTPLVIGDQSTMSTSVSYWLATGTHVTVVMSFHASSLVPEAAEALLELTDAIVSTVVWRPESPVSGGTGAALELPA